MKRRRMGSPSHQPPLIRPQFLLFLSILRVTVRSLFYAAHRGLGLGHEFLRHITRCCILLFVVDIAGSEGRNPIEDLANLRREIDLYDPALSKRPWYIIANKMDLPAARENLEALEHRFPTIETAAVSAQTRQGMESLSKKLEKWLTKMPQSQAVDPIKTDPVSSTIKGGQVQKA